MQYHFNLHGLFGTQMGKVMNRALPENQSNFIFSDSTFPGAGSQGVAHLLPNTLSEWSQLKRQLKGILDFHMF